MLNKWERIQAVKMLGLNSEDSVLVTKNNLGDFLNHEQPFLKNKKIFSLRTFSKDDNEVHPHYPVIDKKKLLKELPLLVDCGYSCIVATCINPKHAELAGCAYKKDIGITLEVAFGAGTVRRVTHDGKIDKTFTTGVFNKRTGDRRLDYILNVLKKTSVTDCIFEFSWYKMPVGHKKQHMIFWEVTGASEKGKIKTMGGGVFKL